jgi:hypothetical protein
VPAKINRRPGVSTVAVASPRRLSRLDPEPRESGS